MGGNATDPAANCACYCRCSVTHNELLASLGRKEEEKRRRVRDLCFDLSVVVVTAMFRFGLLALLPSTSLVYYRALIHRSNFDSGIRAQKLRSIYLLDRFHCFTILRRKRIEITCKIRHFCQHRLETVLRAPLYYKPNNEVLPTSSTAPLQKDCALCSHTPQ